MQRVESGTEAAIRGVRLLARVGFCVSAVAALASAYWFWLQWRNVDFSDPLGTGVEMSHAFYLSVGWASLAGAGLVCASVARVWLRRHAPRVQDPAYGDSRG